MKKDDVPQYHDDTNLHVKRKMQEEGLDFSSTGYGLEPVSESTEEELPSTKNKNSSYGGL